MTVEQRIRLIKLIEQIDKDSEIACEIGVSQKKKDISTGKTSREREGAKAK